MRNNTLIVTIVAAVASTGVSLTRAHAATLQQPLKANVTLQSASSTNQLDFQMAYPSHFRDNAFGFRVTGTIDLPTDIPGINGETCTIAGGPIILSNVHSHVTPSPASSPVPGTNTSAVVAAQAGGLAFYANPGSYASVQKYFYALNSGPVRLPNVDLMFRTGLTGDWDSLIVSGVDVAPASNCVTLGGGHGPLTAKIPVSLYMTVVCNPPRQKKKVYGVSWPTNLSVTYQIYCY